MSMATSAASRTCFDCGDSYEPHEEVGECCSSECHYRRKGTKKLNLITHDHTVCGSCGRIRAHVTPPKPDEAFAIDWSYGSAFNVDNGVVNFESFGQEESAKAAIGFRQPTEAEKDGACLCGTIGRTDEHRDLLHEIEVFETLLRIHERIKSKAIDGECEQWPSKAALFRYYEETADLPYSVGKAL